MASIFTKIIVGEIPSYKVAEDENFIAFLDVNPNTKGHTLVVPKREENKLFDLSKEEYKEKQNSFYIKAGQEKVNREMQINETYFSLYEKGDKLKTEIPLIDYFKIMNDPDVVNHNHGHYLMGEFKMGDSEKDDYFGADNSIWWYSRNLRIFQNILNINTPGEDKVFVLIGAGHLSILHYLANASVDFNLKNFENLIEE